MADLRHRMAPAHVPEAFVVWLWEHRHTNPDLTTTDGIPLQVIYPGRRGSGWGPDLRGALLAIAGRVVRGDVEVHVTARDWARHGHARDSAYDGTVLHVVLEAEPGVVCYRSDGAAVPTVALQAAIAAPLPLLWRRWQQEPRCRPPVEPCRTPEEAAALLDEAGMERFATRVDRYEADIALVGAPQALWAGLCDALGYTANRTPFRALADRVPVQDLLSMRSAERPLRGQAVLFGAAGLLPHQRGRLPLDGYARALLREWETSGLRGPREPLGWRWIGVRPANQPARRVAAAAAIVGAGTLPWLDAAVPVALWQAPPRQAARALAELLTGADDPYWRDHQDFAAPLPRPVRLVGTGRAREIVVNVLLPWAAARGRLERDAALSAAAEAAYRAHPRLAMNTVTRHMAWQLVGSGARAAVTTACRQQGLHYLFGRWCDARDCASCTAGGAFGGQPAGGAKAAAGREPLW